MKQNLVIWACAVSTFGLIAVVGILTLGPVIVFDPSGSGKIYHMLAFASLTIPLSFAFPTNVYAIVLAAVFYGGIIEVVQPIVGRSAQLGDFLADCVGAIIGGSVGYIISRYRV